MFTLLLAAVTASAGPAAAPQGAAFRSSAAVASAQVYGRILEAATIDYAAAAPAGSVGKRQTSLLIDRVHVGATLIEFP